MLMSGVALSRLGLWMFDLSVIQQMQVIVQDFVSKHSIISHFHFYGQLLQTI